MLTIGTKIKMLEKQRNGLTGIIKDGYVSNFTGRETYEFLLSNGETYYCNDIKEFQVIESPNLSKEDAKLILHLIDIGVKCNRENGLDDFSEESSKYFKLSDKIISMFY